MAKNAVGRRGRTKNNVRTLKSPARVEVTETPPHAEVTEIPAPTTTTAAAIAEKLKRGVAVTCNKVRAIGVSLGARMGR